MKKRVLSVLLVLTMIASLLVGCGGSGGDGESGGGKKAQKIHIGIMLYKDTGDDVEAIQAFCKSLEEPLNMEFTFVTGSLMDNEKNINAIQDLQIKGCQGIVVALCGDTFPGFVDAAAKGKTPIASFYGVPEDYFYYDGVNEGTGGGITSDASKTNMEQWYVGGVEDGVRTGDDGGVYLAEKYFENVVEKGGERNIGLMHFNFTYYPKQKIACDRFVEKVNEWNAANANDPIKLWDVGQNADGTYMTSADFPGNYPGDPSVANESGNCGYSLGFSPIADVYFQNGAHDGMEAIACFGAAGTFVYPKVAELGLNIRIYGSGYDSGSAGFTTDFGTSGKQIMQQTTFSCVESFVYPLVMLANRIYGAEYSDNYLQKASTNKYLDNDITDRRVSAHYNYITDNASLSKVESSCMYATHNAENALITADQIKNLMPFYNPDATYDDLLKVVQNFAVD